jgi:ferredoxin-NADP reductase/MOSC domain-containing protein YiiM/ferredoxin
MPRLLSINVGLPRNVEWRGRSVYTAIWKNPVQGRCVVRRLNLEGDGQGDLAGHGGEHRAVFVYQSESHRFWEHQLGRTGFLPGQFGENFTVEGLADSEVCIGDRYRIGTALFEVTQPRVTCYRVGIRMEEPRMPALLTSSGRPGFYFRVLQEGEVTAGDEIVKVDEAQTRMTVAAVNALLYSPHHPVDQLSRALQIDALSPGWRGSFAAMLKSQTAGRIDGNAGLMPDSVSQPSSPGFRRLVVTSIQVESADVLSLSMESPDGQPLPRPLPGQYVVLRLPHAANGKPLFRSYSLSGPPSSQRYRISVKLEPDGAAGTFLKQHLQQGDALDVSSPRGNFVLDALDGPILFLSAGIGITPLLAMLHALVSGRSEHEVFWVHAARNQQHRPFAEETGQLLRALPRSHRYVSLSQPGSGDESSTDYDGIGRLSVDILKSLGIPKSASVYLCGPDAFMVDMQAALTTLEIPARQIHLEAFDGGRSMTPGIVGERSRPPHVPQDDTKTGALISFSRSGVAAHWNPSIDHSLLELAERCDVPVRWSCRTGVCHNCESGLVSGEVSYSPDPLERPAQGNLLICCSQPLSDLVLDL